MRGIAEAIRDHATEIIDRWDEQNKEAAPYFRLDTRDDRLNDLVNVITTLAFASLPEQAEVVHQKALDVAAEHGAVRRQQGFSSEALQKEYYVLRNALWWFIRDYAGADSKSAADAILRIDRAATLTWQASLLALHQPDLEKRGLWPHALKELIHFAPFLAPRGAGQMSDSEQQA